jgi:Holliday junction resolvase RusA-like endonuclease
MIILKGNPISTNAMYSGRRFLTQAAKVLKEDYGWQIKSQWKQKPLTGGLRVTVQAFFPTKRQRDIDNLKCVFDSLTGMVYNDDSQINELHIYRDYDSKNPRMEIDINEI